jgi:hypothetical protein
MDKPELYLENEIKKANEDLSRCRKVEATVETPGWKEVIEPLLDKTIMDITGGKINGKWYGGLLDRARKDERREYYIGYKQALIDLQRRIMACVDGVAQLESKVNNLKLDSKPRFKTPMVDDTRYGVDR